MLTTTPVETQRELIALVQQLNTSSVDGGELDAEAEQLLVQEEMARSRSSTMQRSLSAGDDDIAGSGDE
eukprot:scaffold409684_cov42-Prasinocladus_malaysianus.AAC.1